MPDLATTSTQSSSTRITKAPSVISNEVSTNSTIFNENAITQQCSTSFNQLESEIIVPLPPKRITDELMKYRGRLNKHFSSLESAYFNKPNSIGSLFKNFFVKNLL